MNPKLYQNNIYTNNFHTIFPNSNINVNIPDIKCLLYFLIIFRNIQRRSTIKIFIRFQLPYFLFVYNIFMNVNLLEIRQVYKTYTKYITYLQSVNICGIKIILKNIEIIEFEIFFNSKVF